MPAVKVPTPVQKASRPRTATPNAAKFRQAAELFKQVSDPTRVQVLLLLADSERNVSDICEELGNQTQPAVSHHLALLRHGRLVEPHRSGKKNYYALTESGVKLSIMLDSLLQFSESPL